MNAHPEIRIASVTIAFNPEPKRFTAQLRRLLQQVDILIVIDNASTVPAETSVDPDLAQSVIWHRTQNNLGIAAALNLGIAHASEQHCDTVLLMDHDSIPSEHMVAELNRALTTLEASQKSVVAAVGPRIVDERNRTGFPFVRLGWLMNQKIYRDASDDLIECDFLISSGTLARIASFEPNAVGPFDESLFIDSVDMEWCYRARSRRHQLYGVCRTSLDHRLGDNRQRIAPSVTLIVHSPLRLYYMTRNRIALYRRGYIPLKWKLKDGLRMLLKLASSALFLTPRLGYLKMGLRGAMDALRGTSGPYRI
jgi:rhamnosyltransferase